MSAPNLVSLDAALEVVGGSGSYQRRLLLVLCTNRLSYILYANSLQYVWALLKLDSTIANAIWLLGMGSGALILSRSSNFYGRKSVLIFS
jgi:hypothetical protein